MRQGQERPLPKIVHARKGHAAACNDHVGLDACDCPGDMIRALGRPFVGLGCHARRAVSEVKCDEIQRRQNQTEPLARPGTPEFLEPAGRVVALGQARASVCGLEDAQNFHEDRLV